MSAQSKSNDTRQSSLLNDYEKYGTKKKNRFISAKLCSLELNLIRTYLQK